MDLGPHWSLESWKWCKNQALITKSNTNETTEQKENQNSETKKQNRVHMEEENLRGLLGQINEVDKLWKSVHYGKNGDHLFWLR